jgi:hypothetical protein
MERDSSPALDLCCHCCFEANSSFDGHTQRTNFLIESYYVFFSCALRNFVSKIFCEDLLFLGLLSGIQKEGKNWHEMALQHALDERLE